MTVCPRVLRVSETSRALSFGQLADEYDRWRPGYPEQAVEWLAPAAPARVADVGAGTGKMTSLLVARGLVVEAVEPDPRMLAVLARNTPQARHHLSVSTEIPVEDTSLDAVLVADAWHWFDTEETILELRRVLKPGGWLGLVWNVAAPPVEPWELEILTEHERYDQATKTTAEGIRERLSYFPDHELELAQFTWSWDTTPEHRAAHMATTSMAIAMSPDERAAYLGDARSRLQAVCDAAERDSMPMRYDASCVRWTPQD